MRGTECVCALFWSNSLSRPHQRFDMRRDGAGEPFEVIAAFEKRDDAALRVFFGDLHQPRRRPGKIRFDKIETAERIEVKPPSSISSTLCQMAITCSSPTKAA